MKKILLALLAAAAFVFASCGNSADTAGIGAGLASGGTGATGGGILPDGTVTINTSKMVYIGEGPETVDGVTYNVKKYAQLDIDDNPYFYTYYKLYFLNGKLRRISVRYHGIGSNMDYKYTDFVEHVCVTGMGSNNIYIYDENGKIESTTQKSTLYEYYTKYYQNGNTKLYVMKQEGKISNFTFHYNSGYLKYYYSFATGYFFTYADNITKQYTGVVGASSSEPLTEEQAEAKLAQLMNE